MKAKLETEEGGIGIHRIELGDKEQLFSLVAMTASSLGKFGSFDTFQYNVPSGESVKLPARPNQAQRQKKHN